MTSEQLLPALIAALLGEGVDPKTVERAVSRVRDLPLGRPLSALADPQVHPRLACDRPMVRAFAFEQARLLERAL